jgi:hypothetical protein
MAQTFQKATLFIAVLVLGTCCLKAQDLIIKNDKSEIKAKVTEITETAIKYKKWDNQDGPTYNIIKTEVFMIIYANGQREIIQQAKNSLPEKQNTNAATTGNDLSSQIKQTSTSNIDTAVDYKSLKLKYKPTRLNVSFQSPLSIGMDQEFRVIKNVLNIGATYNYTFSKDEHILESSFGFIYASLYAPINRLTGNYQMQDKGLFIFGHAGYGATTTKYLDFEGNTETLSTGGFTWRLGADYYISKSFGITVSSYEFKSFYGGIVVSLL